MLMQILSLTDPEAFAAAAKVKSYLGLISSELGIANPWTLEVAIMLSPIGLLTLPPELKKKVSTDAALNTKEEQAVSSVPEIGARLLGNIPRLEEVAQLIRSGVDKERGEHLESKLSAEAASGLSVLRLLYDFVAQEQSGLGAERSLDIIKQRGKHAPDLVDRVRDALQHADPTLFSGDYIVLDLMLKKVMIGDELFEDVLSEDERLLLAVGSRITGPFLERLANYRKLVGIKEPIKVKRFIPKTVYSGVPEAAGSAAESG
jgi:hypothetical protein